MPEFCSLFFFSSPSSLDLLCVPLLLWRIYEKDRRPGWMQDNLDSASGCLGVLNVFIYHIHSWPIFQFRHQSISWQFIELLVQDRMSASFAVPADMKWFGFRPSFMSCRPIFNSGKRDVESITWHVNAIIDTTSLSFTNSCHHDHHNW